jgi:hypothetical protein
MIVPQQKEFKFKLHNFVVPSQFHVYLKKSILSVEIN